MIQYSGEHNFQEFEAIDTSINIDFARELLAGLTAQQKSIPCRFLYDDRGSELFEHITELKEYYPARTEVSILQEFAPEFARDAASDVAIVEFGSGSSTKTELLLDALGSKAKIYVAIEISQAALDGALHRIQERYHLLKTIGICDDFNRGITLPPNVTDHAVTGFFPGSTIGNLEYTTSVELLSAMRKTLGRHASLVVGTDLVKPPNILIPAYNDSQGVTAEFTRNILLHANHAVGTDFCIDAFEYQAIWNDYNQRIEIYLVSRLDQSVNVLGRTVRFGRGERIHIENSHKYTVDGFTDLANQAGWTVKSTWTDKQAWFAVHELVAR